MEYFLICTVLWLGIGVVMPKDLHVKEDTNMKKVINKDFSIDLINIYENNGIFSKNERFVRHVEAITESLLEHLLKEIKSRYKNKGAKNAREVRMMHNLKSKLKKRMKSKRHNRRNHVHRKTAGRKSYTNTTNKFYVKDT